MQARMRFILVVLFLLSSFATTRVHAQATGQLTGSVSDASQAAVPGAEVTATGIGTGNRESCFEWINAGHETSP